MKIPAGFWQKMGLLLLPLWLWTACSGDDYHYPSVTLEFLTARSGADGRLETVLTDKGVSYPVLNEVAAPNRVADSTLRIIANYACEPADGGGTGALLYAATTAISPVPLPEAGFEEGVKQDPASVLSIWMGLDYLNIVLEVKGTDAAHAFHFIEEGVEEEAARRTVSLALYHDAADDPPYYTRRVYLSVPLRPYVTRDAEALTVRFSLRNYEGGTETYSFEYVPQNK